MEVKATKYDELHIFIDESGVLNATPNEENICLVGGVLCWGKYDKQDKALKDTLMAALQSVYRNNDTNNLHYHDNKRTEKATEEERLYWKDKNKLLQFIQNEINTFNNDMDCPCLLEGFSIEHKEDINKEGPSSVTEKEMDNRYLSMLLAVLEHLLYVEPKTSSRLSTQARIHVFVASRKIKFELGNNQQRNKSIINQYKSLGYSTKCEKNQLSVNQSLTQEGLRESLRAIQQRWSSVSSYEIVPENIVSISYQGNAMNQAGYYLADLYLGLKRKQIECQRKGNMGYSLLAPEYLHELYEPAFREFNKCKEHAALGDYGYFEELLWRDSRCVSSPLFNTFKKDYASQVTVSRIHSILDRVRQEIDNPSVTSVFNQATTVRAQMQDILEDMPNPIDAKSRLLCDWIDLAIANHSGNIATGNKVWKRYETDQRLLACLGPENQLLFHTELLLRRIVNLVDSFRYDEAQRILPKEVAKLELVQRFFSENKVIEGANYWPSLGYCYSSLGQIAAFTATSAEKCRKAEQFFRKALTQYHTEWHAADIERTWVYLGHVACDACKYDLQFAQQLWNEVSKNLSLSFDKENIAHCLSNITQSRYVIHLLIKGIYIFGTNADFKTFFGVWQKDNPVSMAIEEMVNGTKKHIYPSGLICQLVGMLFERLYEETGTDTNINKARNWYRKSQQLMKTDNDGLIFLLKIFAEMREIVMLDKAGKTDTSQNKMAELFNDAQTLLICNFEDAAWKENELGKDTGFFGSQIIRNSPIKNKVQAIIDSIRFNYW